MLFVTNVTKMVEDRDHVRRFRGGRNWNAPGVIVSRENEDGAWVEPLDGGLPLRQGALAVQPNEAQPGLPCSRRVASRKNCDGYILENACEVSMLLNHGFQSMLRCF